MSMEHLKLNQKTKNMKTKSIILSVFFAVFTLSAFSQLKVDQYGRIGMGVTWPNSGYKCHIKGNLLLSTYPDNPFIELQFKVGTPLGVQIGTNTDQVKFWTDWVNYHKLFAEQYWTVSDEKYKINKTLIPNPLEQLLALKVYKYDMIDRYIDSETGDSLEQLIPKYGFISQEIEKVFPDIIITKDIGSDKLMDYDQIIPVTVGAIQQQQKVIDSLKVELEQVKRGLQSNNFKNGKSDIDNSTNLLFQNFPNPFSEKTTIQYSIEDNEFQTGALLIFNMNGTLLKQIPIRSAGKGEIIISGYELEAGKYIYSLIVNQIEVDSKKMILLK